MGLLLAIAIKHKKRGTMCELNHAQVTTTSGVANDFRGKPGARQVTLLTREGWLAACKENRVEYPWLARRANLYIEGVNLYESSGKCLTIGQLQLLITQETEPCSRMREVDNTLFDALNKEWRGGVCCRVIQGGFITIGDAVEITDVR